MKTRRLAATGLLALTTLAACSSESPDFGGSADGDPTLVLRIDEGGGFVPAEWNFTRQPALVLMSDGKIYTAPAMIEIYPGPLQTGHAVMTITAEAIAEIRERAQDAGLTKDGVRGPNEDGATVADATTTVFTYVDTNGTEHTVSAYALGFTTPETPERQSLVDFREDMTNLGAWLPEGSITDEGTVEPATAMRIGVRSYTPDENVPQQPKAWPLDTPLAEFGEARDDAVVDRCGVLTGQELDTFLNAAKDANTLTPWTSGGDTYGLLVDPLTPDEARSCDEAPFPSGM